MKGHHHAWVRHELCLMIQKYRKVKETKATKGPGKFKMILKNNFYLFFMSRLQL